MKILAKMIAFLVAIILVVVLPLTVLMYNVGHVIFNPLLITEIFSDIVLESDLVPAGLQWFAEQRAEQRYADGTAIAWQDEPDIIDLLSFVDMTGWQIIREEVLPNEILGGWISSTVNGAYAWIDSDQRLPNITWDMRRFKEQVISEHGANAVQLVYDALSPCSDDEIADFKSRLAAAFPGMEILYALCQFPGAFGEDQIADYHDALSLVVGIIPDSFALTQQLENLEDIQGVDPLAIKARLLFLRTTLQLAPFIPLLLLLIILTLAIRSLQEAGRWWGIPLMISGVLLFIPVAFYRSAIISVLSTGVLREVPPLVRDEALGGIMQLATKIFRPMMWQSIMIFALGLLLFIVSLVVKPKFVE